MTPENEPTEKHKRNVTSVSKPVAVACSYSLSIRINSTSSWHHEICMHWLKNVRIKFCVCVCMFVVWRCALHVTYQWAVGGLSACWYRIISYIVRVHSVEHMQHTHFLRTQVTNGVKDQASTACQLLLHSVNMTFWPWLHLGFVHFVRNVWYSSVGVFDWPDRVSSDDERQ